MLRKTLVVISLIFLVGCGERKPTSFHECITKNIKPGLDEMSVNLITFSCREQFPEKDLSRPLTSLELNNVTGNGGISFGQFRATLYNGNANITITEMVVRIEHKSNNEKSYRDYKINTTIEPLRATSVSEVVFAEAEFEGWSLVSCRAYPRK